MIWQTRWRYYVWKNWQMMMMMTDYHYVTWPDLLWKWQIDWKVIDVLMMIMRNDVSPHDIICMIEVIETDWAEKCRDYIVLWWQMMITYACAICAINRWWWCLRQIDWKYRLWLKIDYQLWWSVIYYSADNHMPTTMIMPGRLKQISDLITTCTISMSITDRLIEWLIDIARCI